MVGSPLVVLLIEDDAGYAKFVEEVISDVKLFSLKLFLAGDFKEGFDRLSKERIDVILLDLNLPDSSGLDTFTNLKDLFPDIPIVIISSIEDEDLAYRAVSEGAQDYIFKTEMVPAILARTLRYAVERKHFQEKLRESEERVRAQYKNIPIPTFTLKSEDGDFVLIDFNDAAPKIAGEEITGLLGKRAGRLLQDEPEILRDIGKCFKNKASVKREYLYKFRTIGLTKYLSATYSYVPPDLVIVHAEDITDRKIAEERLKKSRIELELRVKERTIQLVKVNVELKKEISERKKAEDALRRLSITDSLTNLYNQRHFHKNLEIEITRAKRMLYPLVVLLFDLDDFKEYNDTYGHLAGDSVLKSVGSIMRRSIRNGVDTAYRFGGDEFAVILPHTKEGDAMNMANRISEEVVNSIEDIGISVGIASLDNLETVEDFINTADRDMYSQKRARKKKMKQS
ncbi:MAG: diguanylate cyclase [Deltaproteobacteria bacterium]|uniref:Diguanylate cyclase n=1 Tax=Candidatus Zymogenus saltonus TaxID=2844893 RepID=A0A9D8KCY7_9DELT|nr:diguanylate cyclase [Candidatus Zymogenus saltonus]